MKGNKQMKAITNLTYPVLALFAFVYFALSPQARAVCEQGCDLTNGNTFLGDDALINNTTGSANTATGFQALFSNTTGFSNTAHGAGALYSTTTGNSNTATGTAALGLNTIGGSNTATGRDSLGSNTTGNSNTADGYKALTSNRTGGANTATGHSALISNTTGEFNTADGTGALLINTTGNNNIALGASAGTNLTTGSNNIDIGNSGRGGESGVMRIGTEGQQTATFIAGIKTSPLAVAVAVAVTPAGQLGVRASSERYKEAIKPMDKASEAILALKPVTFRYKKELDPKRAPQFGLVAEEVAKVDPDLVVADDQGKPFTVRYEEVNAMLLNEFLKEHETVHQQGRTIARLEQQLETVTATLQKVSAQLEQSKPAPQTVLKNQ
jgi:Chaperone of endosialidase